MALCCASEEFSASFQGTAMSTALPFLQLDCRQEVVGFGRRFFFNELCNKFVTIFKALNV